MKKNTVAILLLTLIFSLGLFSQNGVILRNTEPEEPKKINFQLRAGLNISTLSATMNGRRETEKSKIGYQVGGVVDINLGKSFYFQPGLTFTAKGSKIREVPIDDRVSVDLSMNALYLQIPVYFTYKMGLPKWSNSFNVALGPYFAYGVGGKISGAPVKINTFGAEGLANRFDVGIGMELQFELPKLVFFYGTELGFANMLKKEYFSISTRNTNLYFGVGYKL